MIFLFGLSLAIIAGFALGFTDFTNLSLIFSLVCTGAFVMMVEHGISTEGGFDNFSFSLNIGKGGVADMLTPGSKRILY